MELRIVTYNVHRCRGLDRRILPRRIAEILGPLQADIIALQEVLGKGPSGRGQDEELGAALGMGWVMAPTRYVRKHLFGNVVLSRFPIAQDCQFDLTWKKRKARCCQRADLRVGSHLLRVYNVHLGTGLGERRYQAGKLARILEDQHTGNPQVVLGDFNEWGRGLTSAMLTPGLKSLDLRSFLTRRRTYPGFFPLLHLDHIFYDPRIDVFNVEIPRTRLAKVASDHLPIVADLRVRF